MSFGGGMESYTIFGKTPFDAMDFMASNVLMPLGGMFAATFVGWRIWPQIKTILAGEVSVLTQKIYWLIAAVVSPVLIAIVAIMTIKGS